LSLNIRNIKLLALVAMPLVAIALAVVVLAGLSNGSDSTEAAGPTAGMSLAVSDTTPFVGQTIVIDVIMDDAPDTTNHPGCPDSGAPASTQPPPDGLCNLSGWQLQVNTPAGLKLVDYSAGDCTVVLPATIAVPPPASPATQLCVYNGTQEAVGVVVSNIAVPPLETLVSADGQIIMHLEAICNSPFVGGLINLPTSGGDPDGGSYFDTNAAPINVKGPDSEAITCAAPPPATPTAAMFKNVSANLSATKVLAGGTVDVSGSANFQQDLDGDTVAGWGSATISISTTAGAVKMGTISANGNAVCVPAANGGTCTANVNKGPASPASGPESAAFVNYSNTINCTAIGTHDVVVTATFTREDGSAVPGNKSTNNTATVELTCNPLTPPIQKIPALSNLFLTHQNSPKLPPLTCATGDDTAVLQEIVGFPITSLDPKGGGFVQQLAAFEFEVRFDPKLVCVNLVPGPGWSVAGVTCLVLDKDTSLLEGIARLACFSTKPVAPGNAALHLANIVVRPQPELYSQIRANQENGIVAQILNQDCELADQLGHPIAIFSCEDAELTIRFLEGDVNADCVVDVLDGQALAFRWNAIIGNLLYGTRYDLEPSVSPGGINGDGDVDVKDIQFVFGRQGSTCANPNPPQPPENPKA